MPNEQLPPMPPKMRLLLELVSSGENTALFVAHMVLRYGPTLAAAAEAPPSYKLLALGLGAITVWAYPAMTPPTEEELRRVLK